jgi:hypothetical protein
MKRIIKSIEVMSVREWKVVQERLQEDPGSAKEAAKVQESAGERSKK